MTVQRAAIPVLLGLFTLSSSPPSDFWPTKRFMPLDEAAALKAQPGQPLSPWREDAVQTLSTMESLPANEVGCIDYQSSFITLPANVPAPAPNIPTSLATADLIAIAAISEIRPGFFEGHLGSLLVLKDARSTPAYKGLLKAVYVEQARLSYLGRDYCIVNRQFPVPFYVGQRVLLAVPQDRLVEGIAAPATATEFMAFVPRMESPPLTSGGPVDELVPAERVLELFETRLTQLEGQQ